MRKYWLAFFALALVAIGGFAIYRAVTKTTLGLIFGGSAVSSSTVVNNLSSSDRDLVMTSLDVLKERNDPSGQPQARKLLNSPDDYIWFNAALYLGVIHDQEAIPFLIKGLKHPAYRAYAEVATDLQALTGQTFGIDQPKWIAWWKQQKPGSGFSFAYASLERQAAELHTGSTILINGVNDPLTISFAGSPISLVGLRLKAGANAAQAQRLLETAILAQWAELERDGDQVTPDGAVQALIYWVPDPSNNNPSLMVSLRQGLPQVPFTHKACVQGYLLQSGLYELDTSVIHSPGIRTTLQTFVPATKPAG